MPHKIADLINLNHLRKFMCLCQVSKFEFFQVVQIAGIYFIFHPTFNLTLILILILTLILTGVDDIVSVGVSGGVWFSVGAGAGANAS